MNKRPFRFTSLVSTIADPFCSALAAYLSARLAYPVEFIDAVGGSREELLDTQAVDLAWLCGLLFLYKTDAGQQLTPVVAPCMIDEVPSGQPVYYADIIVRAQSHYQTFADLRGATWAYNEEASFSGYQMVRAHLAQLQKKAPYFGHKIRSGAHLQSLELVRNGKADCAAIDSTIMQMGTVHAPASIADIRTIARLGPYPMPPLAFTEPCTPERRQPLIGLLSAMHLEQEGNRLLAAWQIAHFAEVNAETYAPLQIARNLAGQLNG